MPITTLVAWEAKSYSLYGEEELKIARTRHDGEPLHVAIICARQMLPKQNKGLQRLDRQGRSSESGLADRAGFNGSSGSMGAPWLRIASRSPSVKVSILRG